MTPIPMPAATPGTISRILHCMPHDLLAYQMRIAAASGLRNSVGERGAQRPIARDQQQVQRDVQSAADKERLWRPIPVAPRPRRRFPTTGMMHLPPANNAATASTGPAGA